MHKSILWLLVLAFIFLASCFPFFCLFSTHAFTHVYVAVLLLCQQAHTHIHHIINLVPVSQTDSRTHSRFTQWRYKQHATAALRHKDREQDVWKEKCTYHTWAKQRKLSTSPHQPQTTDQNARNEGKKRDEKWGKDTVAGQVGKRERKRETERQGELV